MARPARAVGNQVKCKAGLRPAPTHAKRQAGQGVARPARAVGNQVKCKAGLRPAPTHAKRQAGLGVARPARAVGCRQEAATNRCGMARQGRGLPARSGHQQVWHGPPGQCCQVKHGFLLSRPFLALKGPKLSKPRWSGIPVKAERERGGDPGLGEDDSRAYRRSV